MMKKEIYQLIQDVHQMNEQIDELFQEEDNIKEQWRQREKNITKEDYDYTKSVFTQDVFDVLKMYHPGQDKIYLDMKEYIVEIDLQEASPKYRQVFSPTEINKWNIETDVLIKYLKDYEVISKKQAKKIISTYPIYKTIYGGFECQC